MDRNYGGVVWTNHALQRLAERNIKQGDAWATFRNPQESRYAKSRGAWIYYRTYGREKIEVVASQNDLSVGQTGKKEWVILSVWSRPVDIKDQKKQSNKGNIFLELLKRLFKK